MATVSRELDADGVLFPMTDLTPRLTRVARRGPVLRPSPTAAGVYGLDMTAGCFHGCGFCHIRGSSRFPGEDRVLFDPFTTDHLKDALDEMDLLPSRVVMSPSSDPLPPLREIRDETFKSLELLLARGIDVQIMTRGRFPRKIVSLLADHRERVSVAVALTTMDKMLGRALEPRAASPSMRVADIGRLVAAGIDVEVRLEPLIPGLTDTRDNLAPLMEAIASAGGRRVVAHYLFLQSAMGESLDRVLLPLGWVERLKDSFEGGRVFRLGTLGPTKHLPLETRRAGFTRLISLGAEFGLWVTTGSSQNPDLPKLSAGVAARTPPSAGRTSAN